MVIYGREKDGERVSDDSKLCRDSLYEYFARDGGYSNIKNNSKNCGGRIWNEVSMTFSVSLDIVVFVEKGGR